MLFSTRKIRSKSFLFIGGAYRSGTTATAEILHAHSEMCISMERFLFYSHRNDDITLLRPELFDYQYLSQPKAYETNHLKASIDLDKWNAAMVIGDKAPDYYLHLDYLLKTFRNAKFIFLTRNVFDVAASCERWYRTRNKKEWDIGTVKAVEIWNESHRLIFDKFDQYPNRIFVLSYEQFFTFSPALLERLTNFIGVGRNDQNISESYLKKCDGWMQRFRQQTVLTKKQYEYIQETANFEIRDRLVALASKV